MAIFLIFALLFAWIPNQLNAKYIDPDTRLVSNVVVIGAGNAGLMSTLHLFANRFRVTVYEQTDHVGGIWSYSEETGKDQYGVDIYSPMYQGLRTLCPHVIMAFPDHPYPEHTAPFPTQPEVMAYIESYANRFNLKRFIKFNHLVVRVSPIENDKWEVIVKNLPNNTFETHIYDAVFDASGHFTKPQFTNIPGANEFNGKYMHSKHYRRPDKFIDEDVLVIGAGISGRDITAQLSTIARRITISQHKRTNETKEAHQEREKWLPPNVVLQHDVKRFTSTGAEFVDGTHQNFTVIICATGYEYSYPFLSIESGIYVEDNVVQPLYKQIFNIQHPTMAFIGIPYAFAGNPLFDIQVRFALQFISGEKQLPSKAEMMADMREQYQIIWNKGLPKRRTHRLKSADEYFKQLADTGDIQGMLEVFLNVDIENYNTSLREPTEYRKYKYTLIDDKTFIKEKYEVLSPSTP